MSIFKYITISDLVSLMNLLFGILAIIFNNILFIFIATIFDILDGYVAKLTNTQTEFGKELDSLCDAVSFGFAPAYFLWYYFGLVSLPFAILFAFSGILRLARYNIRSTSDYFQGIPITIGAVILISMILISIKYNLPTYLLFMFSVLVSIGMVSDIKYGKSRNLIYYVIYLFGIVLTFFNIPEVMFILSILYIIHPLIEDFLNRFTKISNL